MPINYIDPTGIIAQITDDSAGGGWDRLKNQFQSGSQGGGSGLEGIRTSIDYDERQQAYSMKEIVSGITGGNQAQADAIISNFITTKGSPFNARDHFFNVLESWESSLPLNSMWLVFFTVPDIVRDEVMGAWGEHIVQLSTVNEDPGKDKPTAWWKQMSGRVSDMTTNPAEQLAGGVNLARKRLIEPDLFTKVFGCAFAQTVTIPQEQLQTEQLGIPGSRGFIRTPVVSHRQAFASLNIEFLETNISFVDFLLRPWTVIGSHLGSVARQEKLVTDVMVINFARAGFNPVFGDGGSATTGGYTDVSVQNSRGFIPRKIWIFNGCQPITIDSQRHTYGVGGDIERRTIEWMFRRYQCYLPPEFEGLFDSIHQEENAFRPQSATRLHALKDAHNAAQKLRTQRKGEQDTSKEYWSNKDGTPNPFDRPDLIIPKGDGVVRGFPARNTANMASWEAESDANSYWQGYDKQYNPASKLGGDIWTVDSRGYDQGPGYTPVPGDVNDQEIGWDKEAEGDSRKVKTKRPYGYGVTSNEEGLVKAREESKRYGEGVVRFSRFRKQFAQPDTGTRYQLNLDAGQFTVDGVPESQKTPPAYGHWTQYHGDQGWPTLNTELFNVPLEQGYGGDARAGVPSLYSGIQTQLPQLRGGILDRLLY